jgi:hypothetical protein
MNSADSGRAIVIEIGFSVSESKRRDLPYQSKNWMADCMFSIEADRKSGHLNGQSEMRLVKRFELVVLCSQNTQK